MSISPINSLDHYLNVFEEESQKALNAKAIAQKALEKVTFPLEKVKSEFRDLETRMGTEIRGYYEEPLNDRLDRLSKRIKIYYSGERLKELEDKVKKLSQQILTLEEKVPNLKKTFKEKESKVKEFEDTVSVRYSRDISEETRKVLLDALVDELYDICDKFYEDFDALSLKIKQLEFVNAPQDLIDKLVEEQKGLEKKLAYDIAKSEFKKIAIKHHEVVSMGENLQPKILAEFDEKKREITEQVKADLKTELESKLKKAISEAMNKAKPEDKARVLEKVESTVKEEIDNKVKKEVAKRLCEWIEPRFKEAEKNYNLGYEKEVELLEEKLKIENSDNFDPKDEKYLELESKLEQFRNNTMKPLTDTFVTADTLRRLANYQKTIFDFELKEYNISKELTGISGQLINILMRIVEVIRGLFN